MKEMGLVLLMGFAFGSCTSQKQYGADCAPQREKHVNKMQMIPMDTVKQENRPKYD